MIIAQTLDISQLVTPNEATILDSGPDTVTAVHHKSSLERDMEM